MSQTYQRYLLSLNVENQNQNEDNDWGQHYDMELETQMFITQIVPLKDPIVTKFKHTNEAPDIENGLQNYTINKSNKGQCKCSFITSVIYISHLILFIILFK
jgi:hypothetical protein